MSTLSTQPYKGTRDYFPEDKRIQQYLFSTWKRVVERYGYNEYGAPILEPLELYAAKSGQELVNEQTYVFTDRGGRTVAIRPEMTPTVSRMVAAKRQEFAYPARLYSIANFMRYERPQRGREREFWQLNVDLFGAETIEADAEIIGLADAILKEFGATDADYKIRLNNRRFISYMMAHYLGLDEVQAQQMMKLFDRRGKITDQDFREQAGAILGADDDERIHLVTQILDADTLAALPEELKQSDSLKEIQQTIDTLEKRGVKSIVFDPTLMRGLDYYTGMVFEVFDTHPDNNRSLFGGGRYDGLVGAFGVEPISAVGMAPGSTMFEHFLSTHGLLPVLATQTKVAIVVMDGAYEKAHHLASRLRAAGVNTEIDVTDRKLDKQVKSAMKKAIPFIVYIRLSDEDSFSLRDVERDAERRLSLDELVSELAS